MFVVFAGDCIILFVLWKNRTEPLVVSCRCTIHCEPARIGPDRSVLACRKQHGWISQYI